jgi:hypothetical protein
MPAAPRNSTRPSEPGAERPTVARLPGRAAVFPGWLTLWLAVLGDMGASVLVTLNGMRLLAERPRE